MQGRTFVMGDIHGGARAVEQCLERAVFDLQLDRLICLGDVCDGWPETDRAIDILLQVKNLVYLLGNHDFWMLSWIETGVAEDSWVEQGGKATLACYSSGIPPTHHDFLIRALPFYHEEDLLFVHAGFQVQSDIRRQSLTTLLWDRQLASYALKQLGRNQPPLTSYREVYVGHTPHFFGVPVCGGGVWLMDTGAGWHGQLSLMNIVTKEVFMSDHLPSLYPGIEGRRR